MNSATAIAAATPFAPPPSVNWEKLAQIEELQAYFADGFAAYQGLIEAQRLPLQQFTDHDLHQLALLRVLEITNGCLQWSFRRQDPECLSAEQTRECMRRVIGFIKRKQMYFPSQGWLRFTPLLEAFIDQGRQLYQDAFKRNAPGKKREYYAASTAQFIEYGSDRLEAAQTLVKQDYESLFTPYFIDRGRRYIAPYLACLSE